MLSQTVSVTVRLKVVAMDPSKQVVASRLGRNVDPFGGGDDLGHADLDPGDGSAAEQPGGADGQVVVEDVGDRGRAATRGTGAWRTRG